MVAAPAETMAKAALYVAMREAGLCKTQLAVRLGVAAKEVRRLLGRRLMLSLDPACVPGVGPAWRRKPSVAQHHRRPDAARIAADGVRAAQHVRGVHRQREHSAHLVVQQGADARGVHIAVDTGGRLMAMYRAQIDEAAGAQVNAAESPTP